MLHYAHNPLFQKVLGKSPPRKSKMDIFKMSKMKIFRILLQTTFFIRLLFHLFVTKNNENEGFLYILCEMFSTNKNYRKQKNKDIYIVTIHVQ